MAKRINDQARTGPTYGTRYRAERHVAGVSRVICDHDAMDALVAVDPGRERGFGRGGFAAGQGWSP